MAVKRTFDLFTDFLVQHLASYPPFKRLSRAVNKHLSPKHDVAVKVHGCIMYASTLDRLLALYLWKFSSLEGFEKRVMERLIGKGMVVFDIGANIGYYTLIFARFVGKKGVVYSFEPDPENYRLLLKNITSNNLENVVPIQKAVSDEDNRIKFYLSEEHRGDHRLYNPGDNRREIYVDAITLDKFTKTKIIPDLIKMDIQGAEYLAFCGMEKTIKKSRKLAIMCEFSPAALRQCGSSPQGFISLMKKHGFKISVIDARNSRIIQPSNSDLTDLCNNYGNQYTNLLLKK